MHVYKCVQAHVHVRVCTCVHVCVCTRVLCICVPVCMRVCVALVAIPPDSLPSQTSCLVPSAQCGLGWDGTFEVYMKGLEAHV